MVLQEVLERRTERSALLLRALLGKIRLEPGAKDGPTTGLFPTCSPCSLRRRTDADGPEPGSTSL